jgi:hypothetical protein
VSKGKKENGPARKDWPKKLYWFPIFLNLIQISKLIRIRTNSNQT